MPDFKPVKRTDEEIERLRINLKQQYPELEREPDMLKKLVEVFREKKEMVAWPNNNFRSKREESSRRPPRPFSGCESPADFREFKEDVQADLKFFYPTGSAQPIDSIRHVLGLLEGEALRAVK